MTETARQPRRRWRRTKNMLEATNVRTEHSVVREWTLTIDTTTSINESVGNMSNTKLYYSSFSKKKKRRKMLRLLQMLSLFGTGKERRPIQKLYGYSVCTEKRRFLVFSQSIRLSKIPPSSCICLCFVLVSHFIFGL